MAVTILSTVRQVVMNNSGAQDLSFIDSSRTCQTDDIWNFPRPTTIHPQIIEISGAADCSVCNDRSDFSCSACTCHTCMLRTSAGKRYRCSHCGKGFHELCRTNWEPCIDLNQWICKKCKDEKNEEKPATVIEEHGDIKDPDEKLPYNLRARNFTDILELESNNDITIEETTIQEEDRKNFDPEFLRSNFRRLEETIRKTNNGLISSGDHTICGDLKMDIVTDKVVQHFLSIRKINNRGRRRMCTVVPSSHFGPIPGIPVGTCWKFRIQVSESGVHRPLVAGIAGSGNQGAVSIVLSGVYEQDYDLGDEFYYSGCGGKMKDPRKRLCIQVADQQLTRHNKALALCCNAPLNDQGAAATHTNWRDGKPVRVVRNYKLKRFSKYAPEEGNRYDGIYKVVQYFPTKNKDGLQVWRYLMRRDDIEPAPWTDEGKRLIEQRNLKIIYPEDWMKDKNPKKRKLFIAKNELIEQSVGCCYNESKHPSNLLVSTGGRKIDDSRYDIKPNITMIKNNLDLKMTNTLNNNFDYGSHSNWSSISNYTNNAKNRLIEQTAGCRYDQSNHPSYLSMSTIEKEIDDSRYDIKPIIAMMKHNLNSKTTDTLSNNFDYESSSTSNFKNTIPIYENVPDSYTTSIPAKSNDALSSHCHIKVSSSIVDESRIPLKKRTIMANNDIINERHYLGETLESFTINSGKTGHQLPEHVLNLIHGDLFNKSTWEYCLSFLSESEKAFLDGVKIMFMCPICKNLPTNPVTAPCDHNLCLACITAHFDRKLYSCPSCNVTWGKVFEVKENKKLNVILNLLFPKQND